MADLAAGVALNRAVVNFVLFFFFQAPPLQAVGVGHLADLAAGVALWPLKAPLQAGGVEHLADFAVLDRAVVNFSKPPLQAGGVGHLADLADLGLVIGGRPLPAAAAVVARRSPLAARRWRSPDFTRPRHAHQGHDESAQRGFQQVFCGSGRRGDEHVGQGTAAQPNSYRIIGTLTV